MKGIFDGGELCHRGGLEQFVRRLLEKDRPRIVIDDDRVRRRRLERLRRCAVNEEQARDNRGNY
jgi:hypothetical protein